jgi:hypothetical protein
MIASILAKKSVASITMMPLVRQGSTISMVASRRRAILHQDANLSATSALLMVVGVGVAGSLFGSSPLSNRLMVLAPRTSWNSSSFEDDRKNQERNSILLMDS